MRVFNITTAAIFFACHLANASNEREVLHEIVYQNNAGTALRPTEKTYPYTMRIVHAPEIINPHTEKMQGIGAISVDYSDFQDTENAVSFGMGEFKFANNGDKFLHTYGLRDCIALVGFDEDTKKSVLYHVSKMELYPSYFGNPVFESTFIPEFFNFFGSIKPKITLIGSCYSDDFYRLLDLMKTNGLQVSEYNFPDVVMEKFKKIDEISTFTLEESMTIFVNKTNFPSKEWGLPHTEVLLNTQDGSIKISRK